MQIFLFVFIAATLLFNKCSTTKQQQTQEPTDNIQTLQALYSKYKNGVIERCTYNGDVVYKGGLNAPDAGSAIFNKEGIKIGSCNYGWGKPDSMCLELKDCAAVYRVADNIWDEPAVDTYNLGSK